MNRLLFALGSRNLCVSFFIIQVFSYLLRRYSVCFIEEIYERLEVAEKTTTLFCPQLNDEDVDYKKTIVFNKIIFFLNRIRTDDSS